MYFVKYKVITLRLGKNAIVMSASQSLPAMRKTDMPSQVGDGHTYGLRSGTR